MNDDHQARGSTDPSSLQQIFPTGQPVIHSSRGGRRLVPLGDGLAAAMKTAVLVTMVKSSRILALDALMCRRLSSR